MCLSESGAREACPLNQMNTGMLRGVVQAEPGLRLGRSRPSAC